MKKKKIAVLVSGSGTNFQKILEAINKNEIRNAEVSLLISDRECYAMKRAEAAGIPVQLIPRGKGFSSRLDEALPSDLDLIVLAGFLSVLNSAFCQKWEGKIINLHPALLPKYGGKGMYGMKVHEAVKAAGEKESGATVHYVTAEVDGGKIILQGKAEVLETDTPEDIAAKVHQIEYDIFPKAIEMVLNKEA